MFKFKETLVLDTFISSIYGIHTDILFTFFVLL